MKRYVRAYDTGLTGFESTVREVLTNPKDQYHLRCEALSDILTNALADARYELGLHFDIDDTHYVLDGNPDSRSAFTFVAAVYEFELDRNKIPKFNELSDRAKVKIVKHLNNVLTLPKSTKDEHYSIETDFYYSSYKGRPCIEIVIRRSVF